MCLSGASWVQQQILQKQPAAKLQVDVVWLPMLPGDARSQWDQHLLNDPRVTHLWDPGRLSGRWFADHGYGDLPVLWDVFFLYGPDARWEQTPSGLLGWGTPVIAHTDQLQARLKPLLNQP